MNSRITIVTVVWFPFDCISAPGAYLQVMVSVEKNNCGLQQFNDTISCSRKTIQLSIINLVYYQAWKHSSKSLGCPTGNVWLLRKGVTPPSLFSIHVYPIAKKLRQQNWSTYREYRVWLPHIFKRLHICTGKNEI